MNMTRAANYRHIIIFACYMYHRLGTVPGCEFCKQDDIFIDLAIDVEEDNVIVFKAGGQKRLCWVLNTAHADSAHRLYTCIFIYSSK